MSPVDDDQDRDEALDADELALLAYVDGELDGPPLADFEARLRGDRALRARVRALSAIGQFLRDDADRIYTAAGATDLVDAVVAKVDASAEAESSAEPRGSGRHLRLVSTEGTAATSGVSGAGVPGARVVGAPERASTGGGDLDRPSDVHPATSRGARRSKNTVVWAVFGLVAAAAAAFVVYLRANPLPQPDVAGGAASTPVASAPSTATSDTVAVKPPAPAPAPPLAEPTEKVENLEVSEGASIIYTQSGASVVWVTQSGAPEGSK